MYLLSCSTSWYSSTATTQSVSYRNRRPSESVTLSPMGNNPGVAVRGMTAAYLSRPIDLSVVPSIRSIGVMIPAVAELSFR